MTIEHAELTPTFGVMVKSLTNDDILQLEKSQVNTLLKKYGLILFRGFDMDAHKFKEFSNHFNQDFLAYVGGAYSRETINEDKTLLSVTGHKLHFAVPFHGEMYYKKHKPEMMWFYCATPAVKNGETTICDGIEVYQHLSESTQALFKHNNIKYIRTYLDGSWQKIYQTETLEEVEKVCQENDLNLIVNDDRSITTEYTCSGLIDSRCGKHKVFINNILPVTAQERSGKLHSKIRWQDDTKISDEIISEIQKVTDELTFLVDWHAKDFVVFDNQRFMHGRTAFDDDQRDIYVRMGNSTFDWSVN